MILRRSAFDKLTDGLNRDPALTLISAPAGYGKTTLAVSWLQNTKKDAAWLSLDNEDYDLHRLALYVISALQKVRPEIGHDALGIMSKAQLDDLRPDTILSSLIQDLSRVKKPILLVLDDFHFIASSEVQIFIASLIEYAHPYLHCLITTRSDPGLLPLAKWRARNELTEIRAADLKFSLEETKQFLRQVLQLDTSDEQINLLYEQTEGWVTGLQLAGLAARNKNEVLPLNGGQRDLADYLLAEVFDQLSRPRQEFLVRSAIVSRMNSSLCNFITQREDSQSVLEAVENGNLFVIALDEKREWFRYHHLFADFLHKRLRVEYSETEIQGLNMRASQWLAQHGYMTEAIDHALSAADYENAACLIEPQSQRWIEHGETRTILSYLDRLPPELTWHRWSLALWYAWAYAIKGNIESAEIWVNRLESLITPIIAEASHREDQPLAESMQNAYAQVMAIRSVIARHRKDFIHAIALGEQALQLMPEENLNLRTIISALHSSVILAAGDFDQAESLLQSARVMARQTKNPYITFTMLLNEAALAVMRGQLRRAFDLNHEAVRLTQTSSMERLAFLPMLRLGRIYYYWNQLSEGRQQISTALQQADREHYAEAVTRGQVTLAWIQNSEGQYAQAVQTLADAEENAARSHQAETADVVRAVRAQIQFWAGEKEAAHSWMRMLGWDPMDPTRSGKIPNDEAFFLICQILVDSRYDQQVKDMLSWRMADSQPQKRANTILRIHLMESLIAHSQNDLDHAIHSLVRALELATHENNIRPFLDEGRHLLPLFRRIPKTHSAKIFAQKILVYSSNPLDTKTLLEPLNKQELAVLRLLSQGLSNPEIAHHLVLAVSTVRWYVKQIFRKLEVHNRTQAASQAQKLDLL
ncbi:MAG TPA: LuxR C-terminal-related transcriptional regulator [Anaerolineales bacterium]|nr:LuxR C-terminal-related transcriptional regulator [Anaerolineales bacterium]